jgi:ATP-dependent Clp protease, protease subunit
MKKILQFLQDNANAQAKSLTVLRNEATGDSTLYIYDVIDAYWGISAEMVAKAIAQVDTSTTLHVRINSPGGDAFEGRAIATAIANFGGKTISHVDGIAASAATTIANAADEVHMAEGSFYMIHNGFTYAMGDKAALAKTIELLARVDAAINADYAKRTGKTTEQIAAWMDAETWFSAEEAVANGFATAIAAAPDKTQNAVTARTWNLSAFDKTPKALLEPPKPAAPTDSDFAAQRAHNERRLRVLQLA